MFAVYADRPEPADPLSALVLGERPEPEAPDGWVVIDVQAASLNHHDLWTLRGVGISADRFPMTLGCDAAGIDPEGREVIVHAVIGDPAAGRGDETFDPKRSLLSEVYQGSFAEQVAVPARNVIAKPPELTWAEAACLPTAWLTAYRMIATRSGTSPGDTILVQGAGGGVATACIALGKALGLRVWATSREESKRARALELGADEVFESGARLPDRVDAVMETVGEATWSHSLKSLRPGGTLVVSGATSGLNPPSDLARVFFLQLSVVGSTMGTLEELVALSDLCVRTGVRPLIHREMPMTDARTGFEMLASGELFGKVVFTR